MDDHGYMLVSVQKGEHTYMLKFTPERMNQIPAAIAQWIDNEDLDFSVLDGTFLFLSIEQVLRTISKAGGHAPDEDADNPFHVHYDWEDRDPDDDDEDDEDDEDDDYF